MFCEVKTDRILNSAAAHNYDVVPSSKLSKFVDSQTLKGKKMCSEARGSKWIEQIIH